MKQQRDQHGIGVGSACILLVFIVLALTVFSVLTLVTAQNELSVAEKSAELSAAYYTAERTAVIKANDIKKAATSSETDIQAAVETLGATVYEDDFGYTFSFSEEIDSNRVLSVEMRFENDEMKILTWKASGQEFEYDDSVDVWDGSSFPFDIDE